MKCSLTRTSLDKAYGWSIGSATGASALVAFNAAAHALTHRPVVSAAVSVAAAVLVGFVSYKWASSAKARWRTEAAPPPDMRP